ncbi:MAG TPA: hypothetical protein VJB87_01060 [Candidatus Nanoarchaeia archaeon]|nr:hypothetical protein [Candidatus Nanoarchaeia archaeon]
MTPIVMKMSDREIADFVAARSATESMRRHVKILTSLRPGYVRMPYAVVVDDVADRLVARRYAVDMVLADVRNSQSLSSQALCFESCDQDVVGGVEAVIDERLGEVAFFSKGCVIDLFPLSLLMDLAGCDYNNGRVVWRNPALLV